MPLLPNTPFVDGQIVTPQILDMAFTPVFDDLTQYLGHLPRLTDDSLSNTPGQLKDRVNSLKANLLVTAGSGLSINYAAGSALLGNVFTSIAPGNRIVPASTTTIIYLSKAGSVIASNNVPVVRYLLAAVTTDTVSVTNILDLRVGAGTPSVVPNQVATVVFGGQGEDGNYTAVNGASLTDGEYNFNSFTVPAGVTISLSKYTRVKISGDVVIAGTVNVVVNPQPVGGIWSLSSSLTVPGIAGIGIGSSGGEIPAPTYTPAQQPTGSDGSSGTLICYGAGGVFLSGRAFPGGSGGGGLLLECGGNIIVTPTGIIRAKGLNGFPANQVASSGTTGLVSGASGGGSGGYLGLKALVSITVAGTLDVSGGAGGLGFYSSPTIRAEGGNGGGGGFIDLQSPIINTTGSTINVTGGSGDPVDYAPASATAINSNGGSFGGSGGTASGALGNNGTVGVTRIKATVPS